MVLNKVKVSCNKTVLKPTSVVKYKMPSKLHFLIVDWKRSKNTVAPRYSRLLTSHYYLHGFIKYSFI